MLDGFNLLVRKVGIAQTIAERIEHRALVVHIRTSVADVVVHHVGQVGDVFHPRLYGTSGWIHLAKEYVGQSVALLLAAVGDVDDGRHVLLAPVDGVGETADEHQYGIGIGFEHQLHQVFIGQHQRFAVHGFAAVTGDGRELPVRTCAVRMVSYTYNGDVGGCGSLFRLAHAVVFGVDDFGIFLYSIAYAAQNRCFVRRGTTIPVLHDFVRIRAYNGYFTQLSGIEWQEFFVFQ